MLSSWLHCMAAVSFLKVEVLRGPGVLIINNMKVVLLCLPDRHH
jgi:hypothetical protein